MESTLSDGGYLDSVPAETDTMSPLSEENGVIYQQTRDDATGETTTVELEDGAGWYDEMWGGFLQFRTNRLEEIRGGSYAGESLFLFHVIAQFVGIFIPTFVSTIF